MIRKTLHSAQVSLRFAPGFVQTAAERVAPLLLAPQILAESTGEDLLKIMKKRGIARTLVLAHPPIMSNEMVVQLSRLHPEIVPVVQFPAAVSDYSGLKEEELRAIVSGFVGQGAKAIKIHPAADGEGPDCEHYKRILGFARELGVPVILHTGCIHGAYYKDAHMGHAERFEPWFRDFADVDFVLAHTNFHEPAVAIDLAERYPRVWLETSWQPAEVIGEAVRRVGSDRVMFGTDWPFIGGNQKIGLSRIRDSFESGLLGEEDEALVLGENAAKLFKLGDVEAVNADA